MLKEELKKMEQKIEPKLWKPEKAGEEIKGVLIKVQDSARFEKKKIYHLEVKEDNLFSQKMIYGSTILDDRMNYVKIGEYVRIVYQGLIKNQKKQDTKLFEVYKIFD